MYVKAEGDQGQLSKFIERRLLPGFVRSHYGTGTTYRINVNLPGLCMPFSLHLLCSDGIK